MHDPRSGPAAHDVISANYRYSLPVGHGQALLGNAPGSVEVRVRGAEAQIAKVANQTLAGEAEEDGVVGEIRDIVEGVVITVINIELSLGSECGIQPMNAWKRHRLATAHRKAEVQPPE